MKIELKLIFSWIACSIAIIGLGISLSLNITSSNSNIVWGENIEQELADYALNLEQTVGIKKVFDTYKLTSSSDIKEIAHLVIIITIAIACGIWGGIAAYIMTFVQNLSSVSFTESGDDKDKQLDFYENYNKNNLHASVLVGIVASSMVPLFLTIIGSNHLDIAGTPSSYLLIIGFCLLAAVFSRQFITKLADKAINQKFSALESQQTGASVKLDKTLQELKKSAAELSKQREVNTNNSFKIAIVEAQEHFGKYKYSREQHTKDDKLDVSRDISDMPNDKIASCKAELNQAISKIDEALEIKTSARALCMKGNYLRQLYMLTSNKDELVKAKDLLKGVIDNPYDHFDFTKYSSHSHWNLAVYYILLGDLEEGGKMKLILDHLTQAIDIDENLKEKLGSDKDLKVIREHTLFKERFAIHGNGI